MPSKTTKERSKAEDDSDGKSWWQILQGILAGLATIITTTAGLVAVLNQVGILGNSDNKITTPTNPTSVYNNVTAPKNSVAANNDDDSTADTTPGSSAVKKGSPSASERVQAVINDPDGYTNIRSGPGINFSIIARVEEGSVFYTIPQQSDWWPVETKNSIIGYMHSSRIRIQN